MPIPPSQPAPVITPVVSFPTPRGRCDLAFYEIRRGLNPGNRLWTYGEKHPNSKLYPNHELVAVVPQDHEWERWYYVAERADQEKYNWEYTEQAEWETLVQLFLLKRCDFSTDPAGYPAPPAELFDSTDYVVTSLDESEVNDDNLRSLYVTVRVRREKILNNPKVSISLDPQTNTLREVTVEKVPVGTPGSVVGLDGSYSEVRALNTRWALKTTQFMAGLAGNGDEAFQQWEDVVNYSWPDVLDYIRFFAFPSSSGTVKSIGARPVWKRQRYDGPCAARITERWTKDPPVPPPMTPMLPQEIEYNSPLLNVNIPPSLHPEYVIWHTPGTQHPSLGFYVYEETYPETNLLDWPEVHIASFTVRPAMGGYLSRLVEVFRPDGTLFDNVLRLGPPTEGPAANSVVLNWTLFNQVGTLVRYRLDVSTDPEFAGLFLTGYNNKNVGTVTSHTVTGLTPGVQYFARVRATMSTPSATVESNPQTLVARTVASYTVFVNPQLFDGDTLDYGMVNLFGAPAVKTLTINNTGNVPLGLPNLTLSGADEEYWTASIPSPTTVPVGGSSTVGITFEPSVSRAYEAGVTLNFNNAAPLNLELTGSAGSPIASFELESVSIASGATEDFAGGGNPANALPVTRTLTILNGASATSNLTISGWNITGTGAAAWQTVPTFFDAIIVAPGDSTSVILQFIPTSVGSYSALFSLTHDGGVDDFELNLTGTAEMATIPIDGDSLVFTEPPDSPATQQIVIAAQSPTTVTLLPFECSSISISGADSSLFSATYSGGFTLLPANNLNPELEVTFLGASTDGAYSATLELYHDHPTEPDPITVSLAAYVSASY